MFSWKSQYVKSKKLEFESWFYPNFHLPAIGWVICLFFCFWGRDGRTWIFDCMGLAPQPLSCSWVNCISECDAYSKETYYFIKLLFQLFNFVCLYTHIQIYVRMCLLGCNVKCSFCVSWLNKLEITCSGVVHCLSIGFPDWGNLS